MRLIFSELAPQYDTYTFPHAVYAIAEDGDDISEIYSRGFLPYSGDVHRKASIFYLARSLRIDLGRFVDGSENKRVDRKMDIDTFQIDCIAQNDMDVNDVALLHFCEAYIKERFAPDAMPMERLKYILHHDLTTHFLKFSNGEGKLLGVIVCSIHAKMIHYWFAFFDNSLRHNAPIGKWIMWQTIKWAQHQEYEYIYLGTCYGKKSLYKARDFKGITFFDGEVWNPDIRELKRRVNEDEVTINRDRWRRDDLLPG